MFNMRILLDVDGPLADWHNYFINITGNLLAGTEEDKNLSITQTRILDLFTEEGLKRIRKIHKHGWPIGQYSTCDFFKERSHMWEIMGCPFQDLDRTEEAETIVQLVESHDIEFHFCTDPGPHPDAPSDKTIWLREYFGKSSRIHLTGTKHDLARPNAILIDDNLDNCKKFSDTGGWAIQYPTYWTTGLDSSQRIQALSRMLSLVLLFYHQLSMAQIRTTTSKLYSLDSPAFSSDRALSKLQTISSSRISESKGKHSDETP